MSAAVDRLLAALESHGCAPRRSGDGATARCPVHDDQTPSLSVNARDHGRALVYCHVCGREATPRIVEALGLTMQDLGADNGQHRGNGRARRIVAKYNYVDESGELLYQVVRFDPKGFAQRRPNGSGGWAWKLGQVRRVLYHLPRLVKAPAETVVYVVEGEKDCERLAALGLLATTCAGGAEKWRYVDDSPLEGRRVVILPDADDKGRKHAEDVARRLHGRAASVKVLHL